MQQIVDRNHVLACTRGDRFEFRVSLTGMFSRPHFHMEDGDLAVFALMTHDQGFECALLKKTLTAEAVDEEGFLTVVLESEDTVGIPSGTYYYTVKLLKNDPVGISTVIGRTKFIVME